jgi:hypothetical protein
MSDGDPPIGAALFAALLLFALYALAWLLVALWVAFDPASR